MTGDRHTLSLVGMTLEPGEGPAYRMTLVTSDGPLGATYHPVAESQAAVLWLDDRPETPSAASDGMARLADALWAQGVASLRLGFSLPDRREAMVLQALVAAQALRLEGALTMLVVAQGRAGWAAFEVERLFRETAGVALIAPPDDLALARPAAWALDRGAIERREGEQRLGAWLVERLAASAGWG